MSPNPATMTDHQRRLARHALGLGSYIDADKIIEAAELCADAAVAGDDLLAYRYAHAIIRIARTEVPREVGCVLSPQRIDRETKIAVFHRLNEPGGMIHAIANARDPISDDPREVADGG